MKKITKEKGKKKTLVLSCLYFSFWIFVCFCLLLLCIDYYQWIIVQKMLLRGKKIYDILWSREIGGLVVCGYDGISVLFKKNYFVYLFPSSDSAMKTRITVCHYVLSVIWLWRFCLLNIRETWVRDTHGNPAQRDFGHMPFLERHKRHLG